MPFIIKQRKYNLIKIIILRTRKKDYVYMFLSAKFKYWFVFKPGIGSYLLYLSTIILFVHISLIIFCLFTFL